MNPKLPFHMFVFLSVFVIGISLLTATQFNSITGQFVSVVPQATINPTSLPSTPSSLSSATSPITSSGSFIPTVPSLSSRRTTLTTNGMSSTIATEITRTPHTGVVHSVTEVDGLVDTIVNLNARIKTLEDRTGVTAPQFVITTTPATIDFQPRIVAPSPSPAVSCTADSDCSTGLICQNSDSADGTNDCTTPATLATLCSDTNLLGTCHQATRLRTDDVAVLFPDLTAKIASLKIEPGYVMVVCDQAHTQGVCLPLLPGTHNLYTEASGYFANRIASFKLLARPSGLGITLCSNYNFLGNCKQFIPAQAPSTTASGIDVYPYVGGFMNDLTKSILVGPDYQDGDHVVTLCKDALTSPPGWDWDDCYEFRDSAAVPDGLDPTQNNNNGVSGIFFGPKP